MNRRAASAAGILLLWAAGVGLLIRREYFRPNLERLAEAAMRITPGAVFYAVDRDSRQIGFASSTIDTAKTIVTTDDYLVADLPVGGRAHRASARTHVEMSRALRVKSFTVAIDADAGPVTANGTVFGDSLVVLAVASGKAPADTQRVHINGPILLPTLVPLAVALGEKPKVGKRYVLPVFDPTTMSPKDVGFVVRAESLFVVDDSSVFDGASGRWRGVQPDTLRAFQIASEGSGFNGWIDEQGRVLKTTQLGFALRRLPYEVAFENWRMDVSHRSTAEPAGRDILETTAIAADRKLPGTVHQLRVQLLNVDLRGFALDGGRQSLRGDTLNVAQESADALRATYTLPWGGRRLLREFTRPEPLVQSNDPAIVGLALRIVAGTSDPRAAAERINRWVHDSVANKVTFGVPNAIQVLRTRVGDCNEHAQLFLALSRAAGIPSRVAAGLAYVDGKFYYHAWPEVFLNGWVAVDPTFGEFPADAAHLRFTIGGLDQQAELLKLIGNLDIQVLTTGAHRVPSSGAR